MILSNNSYYGVMIDNPIGGKGLVGQDAPVSLYYNQLDATTLLKYCNECGPKFSNAKIVQVVLNVYELPKATP